MGKRRIPAWSWALGLPVLLVVVMAVVTARVPSPAGQVPQEAAGVFTLELFAVGKDGASRKVGALPGAAELHVSASEAVRVKYLPDARGGRVFAVDAKGMPRQLPETNSASLEAGRYDLFALHDLSMREAQALEDAPSPWPPGVLPAQPSERARVLRAVLLVDP
jgi:hypothetical protein